MLRALGLVEIDGRDPIGSSAQRVVLAALVLDRGAVVTAERLAELVWGDAPPKNPAASLQNHVSRLRKVLPDGVSVVAAGAGYRLEADDMAVDIVSFERAFELAAGAAPTDRLDLVDEAIALWRGPPFDELDDPGAAAAAVRLEEVLRSLHELRAESLLALGRTHEAIAELETQRRHDPMRERTVELLMRAHLEAGRKTDALDVYERLRTTLAEQLGLDPSPELRAVEAAILTEEIVADRPARTAPSTGPTGSRVELPASSFHGRHEELSMIARTLGDHRIVTLTGPGGVGKTRLSLHAAAGAVDYHAVTVVELAPLRDQAQLDEVIAGALALRPRTDVSTIRRIVDALGSRRHLLVLDNCEHVIESAAAFVDAAVRGAAGLNVLATSREPLNVDGERLVRIDPLEAGSEAIDLFAERATAADAGFVVDDANRPIVTRICGSLDGLPLAIELAAARLATMSLEEIEDGLEERFAVFNRGRRTADERHRSLRGLVEWSVRGLDDDLRTAFLRTSVFADTFTASSAAVVCAMPERAIADHLASLAERSLLVEQRTPGVPLRHGFLETVRAYAREVLADDSEMVAGVERHADWALGLVTHMRSQLGSAAEAEAVGAVMANFADLRIAHQHFVATNDGDRALLMAAALHPLALFRMHAEMFAWIIETAERFGDLDHADAENVLASASIGSWQSGDLDGARRFSEWAGRVGARSSWPGAGRGAAESLADVTSFLGDPAGAAELFETALERARAEGDELRIVCNLADLAMLVGYQGDVDRVRELIDEARERLGEGSTIVHAWIDYAEGEARAESDPVAAVDVLDRALDGAQRGSARFISGVAGLTRTGLQSRLDDAKAAIPGLLTLMDEWRRGGARVQQWITLRTVVDVLVRLGEFDDAAVILGAVLASESATEAAGADAERLAQAKARIEAELPDAAMRMEEGAGTELEAVVDRVVARLTAI